MTKINFSKWRSYLPEISLSAPTMMWLLIFFLVPTVIVLTVAFHAADPYGGIGQEWTLKTIKQLGNPSYPLIVWRTIWLSFTTTFICLVLAIPVAWYLAHSTKKNCENLLLLIMIPFWTNFLIRIFAWKTFLHPEGILKKFLVFLHLITEDSLLLYRPEAVLAVLVYTYLPYAILPIYAAAEKFDYSLLEAARDLGAKKAQSFIKIFLPGISKGIIAAIFVVFIPALGSYVVPEIVGGINGEMLGNKIVQKVFIERNLPHASALSALLVLIIIVPVIFQLRGEKKDKVRLKEVKELIDE